MLKIFKHFRPREVGLMALSMCFIVAQVYLDLKIPEYMQKITMLVQMPGGTIGDIFIQGGYMLSCAVGSLLGAVITGFLASKIASTFAWTIRGKLFNTINSFSMEEINNFSTSSLITRSTNDITQVRMLITMAFQILIKAPIMAVWAIMKIANKNLQWTWATVGAVLVLCCLIAVIMLIALPRFKKMQMLTDNVNRVAREHLIGVRVVRAYNAESYEEEKFEKVNQDLTDNQLVTMRTMALIMPVMTFIMSALPLSIYWLGAGIINNIPGMMEKATTYSDMIVFSSYAIQVVMSFVMLAMIFVMLPRASVAAKRINEVIDTVPRIKDGSFDVEDTEIKGEVEFKDVSFKYSDGGDCVIENISFKANKGDMVAFIGATGSGKTTLVNLVPRLYEVSSGAVLVDGVDVREYKQTTLHNKIAYVPQRSVLFSGTVESNVNFGDSNNANGDMNDVKKAVEIAQGKDFVEAMENQYQSSISQGGTNVSGGQRQRLAIARAICRKPEIYIFDDTFSALDYKTDGELRKALKAHTSDATTLVVSQRIGTIKNANQIIVLDDGKIVGKGTHDELMETCDVYKEIALSQLSKEELQ